MKCGVPPTLRKALTGLFTPPGMTRFASSNISAERVVCCSILWLVFIMRSISLGQPPGGFFGIVGNDKVRPCSFDDCETFQHGPPLVNPTVLRCGLKHGAFAAHRLRGNR